MKFRTAVFTALAHPALARLEQALASPEIQAAVQKMMDTPAA